MKFDGKRLTEIWETKINYSKLKKPQTNRKTWWLNLKMKFEEDVC